MGYRANNQISQRTHKTTLIPPTLSNLDPGVHIKLLEKNEFSTEKLKLHSHFSVTFSMRFEASHQASGNLT